jgi:lysyl endopeptidase
MKSRTFVHRLASTTLTLLLICGGSATVLAADGELLPRSTFPGVASIDTVERREMPRVDVEALLAEDAARERSPVPVAPRFAKKIDVSYTLDNSGTWETLNDGSRLWRLRIASPGATSLSLGLGRFDIPAGAAFWVHAPDGSGVQGPYTTDEKNAFGGLWTAVVLGDELVAELHLPPRREAAIEISAVNHGYRFFGEGQHGALARQGSCNFDVICREGDEWRRQIRSTARITFTDGIFLYACTAHMINNTAEDDTPYLLTAGHCVMNDEEASTVVAYWNYESPTCGVLSGGTLTQNQSGAGFLASWMEVDDNGNYLDGSDFTLLELDHEPNPTFNVYYAGWDARDYVPNATVTIHQPGGDEKAISFDHDPPSITSRFSSISPGDGLFFRIADWDLGTTEGGSSGSCLFDEATQRCIGNLSGGAAACGNDLPDWYGRMFAHWTGNGTPESRLSDWLDPAGIGELFLDGKEAAAAASNEIWLIPGVASRPGVGTSNWKSQVSLANPGDASRSVSAYYVPDGEVWPGTLLGGPFTVGPKQSLYLDDAVLPQSPTAGSMYLMVDGPGTVAFSRTVNLSQSGVTFGQGVPGILLSKASLTPVLVLPMVHSIPGRYRTNLGFAQTSGGGFGVDVSIYTAEGSLLTTERFRIETGWRQINDIFGKFGFGELPVEGGWIEVRLAAGSPAFWTTYATVIDDGSNSPTYVLPVAP